MNKASTVQLPPIVIIGAPGAGKRTVGELLIHLAGYTEEVGTRVYSITNDRSLVQALREEGFAVLYVYAPRSTRTTRMNLKGGQPSDDHGPTDLVDYSLANIGSVDELAEELADVLSRMQS